MRLLLPIPVGWNGFGLVIVVLFMSGSEILSCEASRRFASPLAPGQCRRFATRRRCRPLDGSWLKLRGGDVTLSDTPSSTNNTSYASAAVPKYGRISDEEFLLTPGQIRTYLQEGCVTIPNVLTPDEVAE